MTRQSTRCTAIVPFRPDPDGERDANLATVLRWLGTMGLDVVVVQHGGDPMPDLPAVGAQRYVHLTSDGAFSKAAACNAGYGLVSSEAVALVDADMLVDSGAFLGCVTRVVGGVDVIRPFGHLVELDRAASGRVRDGADPADQATPPTAPSRVGETIPVIWL